MEQHVSYQCSRHLTKKKLYKTLLREKRCISVAGRKFNASEFFRIHFRIIILNNIHNET